MMGQGDAGPGGPGCALARAGSGEECCGIDFGKILQEDLLSTRLGRLQRSCAQWAAYHHNADGLLVVISDNHTGALVVRSSRCAGLRAGGAGSSREDFEHDEERLPESVLLAHLGCCIACGALANSRRTTSKIIKFANSMDRVELLKRKLQFQSDIEEFTH